MGGFVFHDPVRSGISAAIARCQAAGIRVVMCTGDHVESARKVAQEIGIMHNGHILLDKEIDLIEEEKIGQAAEAADVIAR